MCVCGYVCILHFNVFIFEDTKFNLMEILLVVLTFSEWAEWEPTAHPEVA